MGGADQRKPGLDSQDTDTEEIAVMGDVPVADRFAELAPVFVLTVAQ